LPKGSNVLSWKGIGHDRIVIEDNIAKLKKGHLKLEGNQGEAKSWKERKLDSPHGVMVLYKRRLQAAEQKFGKKSRRGEKRRGTQTFSSNYLLEQRQKEGAVWILGVRQRPNWTETGIVQNYMGESLLGKLP